MPRKHGGDPYHPSPINIHQNATHKTPLGQSKEIPDVQGHGGNTSPATEHRVMEVAKMICEGNSKQTCLEHIMEVQDCGIAQAKRYYQAALNWLIPTDMDGYKKGLLEANMNRLEKIVEECVKKKDDPKKGADYLRCAKDAISEMNKVLGVGNGRVVVSESAEGDKAISIEFN